MNSELRILGISGSLRSQSYNSSVISNAAQRFNAEGNLMDEASKGHMRQLLENLVELMQRVRQPSMPAADSESRSLFATRSA